MMRLDKRLLALALAVLPVAVFPVGACATEVKLYGLLDAHIGGDKLDGNTRGVVDSSGRTPSFWGVSGRTASFWGVSGSEDLGGALKAIFAAESFIRNDTGQTGRFDGDRYSARNAYVGFDGSFGRTTLGFNVAPYVVSTNLFNPFGDSLAFSPMVLNTFIGAGNGVVQGDASLGSSLRYTTPTFGGVTLDVLGSLGLERAVAPRKTGRAVDAQIRYMGAPFSFGIAGRRLYRDASATGLKSDQAAFQVGVAYDAKVVKVYLQHQQQKLAAEGAAGQKVKNWQVGVSVPLGVGLVLFSHVRSQYDSMPAFGKNRATTAIGYDYFLSKRTNVYALFLFDRTDATDVYSGKTQQKAGFGVRHRF